MQTQLEEERQRSKCAYADLAVEIEKHQHVLSLLEEERKGREEEREEREMQLQELRTQLSSVQNQCLELQQDKAEKEKLNREVLELKERLQMKENAESKLNADAPGTTALQFQALEEEMETLKEEHRKEVEKVKQLLNEREKELKFREEEVMGLKASKNQQNQAKAAVGCDEKFTAEVRPDQDSMNVTTSGDILMERYLSSIPLEHPNSVANESLDQCSQLDISARFETLFCACMFQLAILLNDLLSFFFAVLSSIVKCLEMNPCCQFQIVSLKNMKPSTTARICLCIYLHLMVPIPRLLHNGFTTPLQGIWKVAKCLSKIVRRWTLKRSC